jgi:hypothetical protein
MVGFALYFESFLLMLFAWPVWAAGYEMSVWSSPAWGLGLSDSMARLVILALFGGLIWFGLLFMMPLILAAIMLGFVIFCCAILLAAQ